MKLIEYRVTFHTAASEDNGRLQTDIYQVRALSISAGFRKATALALRALPRNWELLQVEFWSEVMQHTLTPAGRRWAERNEASSLVANVALHPRDSDLPLKIYEAAIQTCNTEGGASQKVH
jgi:hypothetical protein